MKLKYCFIFFAVIFVNQSLPVFADQIQLKNGDKLTGTLLEYNGNTLNFETKYAGAVRIVSGEISSIETEKNFLVFLKNGANMPARISPTKNESIKLTTPGNDRLLVSLSDINKIKDPDKVEIQTQKTPEEVTLLDEYRKSLQGKKPWAGSVSLLSGLRTGNREAYDLYFETDWKHTTPRHRLDLKASAGYNETEGVVDNAQARFQPNYRYYFDNNAYTFTDWSFEHDRFKDVTARVDGVGGLGYRFWKNNGSEFTMDAGFGATYLNQKHVEETTDPIAQIGMEYNQKIFEKTELSQILTVYPSLGDMGNVRLRSETKFMTPLTQSLYWSLNVTDDYNSDPKGVDISNNDLAVRSGLQYFFGSADKKVTVIQAKDSKTDPFSTQNLKSKSK